VVIEFSFVGICTDGRVRRRRLADKRRSVSSKAMNAVTRPTTNDIVGKLWGLCNLLKDDGVTYHQYVTELTYLLFLKMAKETETESQVPAGYRWGSLLSVDPMDRLRAYRETLQVLGTEGGLLVKQIYADASSFIKKASTLSRLVEQIDRLDWFVAREEGLGDLYEGLLEKNATETKAGAGQYFTPRALINAIVEVMRPALGDVVQDPAAGTGGFLISANQYIHRTSDISSWTNKDRRRYRENTFYGMEHVQDTHRLALMNLMLHGIESDPDLSGIWYGDTLSPDGEALPPATLILTNPPFGTKKGGGLPSRTDLPVPTSNKQLAFLQHVYRGLLPGGRAAVIVPDNVLFEGHAARQVRVDLMNDCRLHTILRLPPGIFYAPGIKTNVLFFARRTTEIEPGEAVWVYDLRTGAPAFGKRSPIKSYHFADFVSKFGSDPAGSVEALATREDEGEAGRFRAFSRDEIARRGDTLAFRWGAADVATNDSPAEITRDTIASLEATLGDLRALLKRFESYGS
jgi:type I restriction enzyme M protein